MTQNQSASEARAAGWDSIAERFDTNVTPITLEMGKKLIADLNLTEGNSFLDVGAGTGALSIPAAQIGAGVTAVDISPRMISLLSDRAGAAGLDINAQVMDALDLGFEADAFDAAASLNGVTMLPDASPAIVEMARVTRPGGQVQVVGFASPAANPWLTTFVGAMTRHFEGFTGLPEGPPPPPFQFADPARFRQALVDAGLEEVRVAAVTRDFPLRSGQAHWDFMTSSNPIGAHMVAGFTEADQAEAVSVLDRVLQQSDPLTVSFNVAIGRVASGG